MNKFLAIAFFPLCILAGCSSDSNNDVFTGRQVGLWERVIVDDTTDEGFLGLAPNGELTAYNFAGDENCYFIGVETLIPSTANTYTIAGASPNLTAVSLRLEVAGDTLTILQKDIFDINQDGSTEDFFVDQTLTRIEGLDVSDFNDCLE